MKSIDGLIHISTLFGTGIIPGLDTPKSVLEHGGWCFTPQMGHFLQGKGMRTRLVRIYSVRVADLFSDNDDHSIMEICQKILQFEGQMCPIGIINSQLSLGEDGGVYYMAMLPTRFEYPMGGERFGIISVHNYSETKSVTGFTEQAEFVSDDRFLFVTEISE